MSNVQYFLKPLLIYEKKSFKKFLWKTVLPYTQKTSTWQHPVWLLSNYLEVLLIRQKGDRSLQSLQFSISITLGSVYDIRTFVFQKKAKKEIGHIWSGTVNEVNNLLLNLTFWTASSHYLFIISFMTEVPIIQKPMHWFAL